MFYYYHTYYISSGKDRKLIKKVYTDEKVASENLCLMGGNMIKLQPVEG